MIRELKMYVQFVSVVPFPAVVFHLIVLWSICRLAANLLYKKIEKGWSFKDLYEDSK